jgi:hypothetical protein
MQNLFVVSDTTKKICELGDEITKLNTRLYEDDTTEDEVSILSKKIDSLKDQINDLENTLEDNYTKEISGFTVIPITRKEYQSENTNERFVFSWDFKRSFIFLELCDYFYIKIEVTKIESNELDELDICELADSIMLNF